jgi:hypothetical protein
VRSRSAWALTRPDALLALASTTRTLARSRNEGTVVVVAGATVLEVLAVGRAVVVTSGTVSATVVVVVTGAGLITKSSLWAGRQAGHHLTR